MKNEKNEYYEYFVRLGLWKFLEILLKENYLQYIDKGKFASFIWEVSSGSHFNRYDKSIIEKDWQQCWLATHIFTCLYKNVDYSDCEFLSGDSLEESINLLQKDLQFKSLADSLVLLNESAKKELSHLHTRICYSKFVGRVLPGLTTETINILKGNLVSNPGIAHLFVKSLLCSSPSFDITNKQLLNIYKDLIYDCIEELKSNNGESIKDTQSTLLSLITFADDKWSIINMNEYCKNLSALCHAGHIPLSRMLLSAASSNDLQLYLQLSKNEDNYHSRNLAPVKKLDRITLLKLHSELFDENIESLNISELFSRLIKNKIHWIEDVICLYAQLAMYGDLIVVDKCFQHPLLKRFQPLLVFQLWSYASSMNQNQNNLNLICSILDCCKDDNPVLIQLSDTLEWLKFVIEWVDKEVERSIPDINTLLVPARKQSLLHLLKTMTDITRLNPYNVREFIKEAHSKFSRDENVDKEIAIFDGFCILTTVLRSIFLAADTRKKETNSKGCHFTKKLGPVDKILQKNLQNVKEEIDQLQPLYLRLEILENIFSMIFLRSEDLREDAGSDSGADDDDNTKNQSNSGKRFNRSLPIMTSSFGGIKRISLPSPFPQSLPPIVSNNKPELNDFKISKSLSALPEPRVISMSNLLSSEQDNKNKNSKVPVLERGEGFLCSNQLVSDLLNLVKDSVMKISEQKSAHLKENCDINLRLKRLINAVDDGIWRLELLSRLDKVNLQAQNDYKSEWVYVASEGSDSDSELPSARDKPATKRQRKSADSAEKSSESGSNTTGKGSSGGGGSNTKGRKTRQRKNSRKTTIPVSCSLINLMLASPRSLATHFLALNDVHSSSTIIKRFNLDDSTIATDVNFIISYKNLKQKLQNLQVQRIRSKSQNESTLEIINKAATAGFFTASVTREVEQFLSVTRLPDVGEAGCKALVALDLAVTLNASKSHSETLLGLAVKQCSAYTQNGGLAGTILEQFAVLLNQHLQEEKVQNSIPDILRSPDIFMLTQKSKRQLMHVLWSSISIALSSFTAAIDAAHSSNAVVACSELAQIINNARSTWKGEKVDNKNGENYLHQLRAYVTLMSRITAPHISTGTPFSLLDRSLTDILQHLVFQCNVDPEDIEQMLQQLGIDLVFYLVQTCTPDVPILQPVKKPDIIVLNSLKSHEVNHETHPNIVVQRLLTSLISVLQTEGTDFSQKEAAILIEKPSVQQVLQQTSFLADVDLSLISSSDESLVFLVNLMNLMWTHSLLTLETKGNGFGLLSKSSMLREVSCSTVGYNLGKFGFISLHQVNSALIRPILSSNYGFISWNSTSSLSVEPTWDPRILFALTSHYSLSPKLQVLDVVDLDNQLEWCMSDYVRKSVTITDNSVILPSLLQSYLDYTTMTQGPESEDGMETLSNLSKERMACLTDFLKENPAFCQADITGKEIQITDTIGFQICIDYTRTSESNSINNKSISIMDDEWKNKKIEGSVLKYLTVRSPIVGMLVQKLHSIEEAVETLNDHEIHHYLESELNSDRINILSCLFNENHVVTALQSFPDMEILWNWLDEKLMNNELEKCLEMITSLPEFLFCCEPKLSKFKDLLFFKLAGIKADGWLWCQKIKNIDLMAQGVMNYLHNWELNGALAALQTLLTQPGLNDDKLRKAKKFFSDISVCQNILVVYGNCDDWHKIYKSDCWIILEKLLDTKNIELALKWSQMHQIPSSDEEYENNWELIGRLILMLLETHIEITATEMLTKLQKKVAIKICDFVISRAESLQTLRVVIDFLNNILDLPTEMKNNYILLDVGVNMLNEVPENDQQWYRPLISRPDLIVEQMLMCTQLSLLEKSLASVENKIANLPIDNLISRTNLDLLLRKYADKAVDIRVRRQLKPYTADVKSQQTSKVVFIPPDVPPNKDEWVPDDEVVECMSCQVAVFSMFNRRHHCRRCGRVVCSNCSGKTMKVVGYGNVPVRVCDDCFDYAAPKSAQLVHKKSDNDLRWLQGLMDKPDWVLKVDETYNSLIRNEFSYDNAPSISLCLSILKLHSLDTVQPKFLVAISESMLSLLRPTIPGVVNPELDHALLVQMIRSLILGAKVCYSGLGLPAGMAKCDQLLGEVDILNLLVTAHYVFLLPSFPLNNQLAIRNLRSSLLDQELWSLALEVSTKSGLEYGSVWFAWGKACLRGGAWKDAREKFSHCSLQKKDLQNAGMLADILQILLNEEGSSTLEARLGKLDTVINGKQKIMKFKEPINTKLDEHVYKECMYYLSRYGSHSQNLDFLLTHGDIKQVLDYIRKTKIEPDYFVENVYLPCLRTGCIASLHQAMTSIDPKLLTWKVELKTLCAWCERREMFNVLYQVQLWLCDYVRASMTCIRFYHGGARCYSDLITNVQHLHTAISNLQTASNTQHSGSRNQVPIDNDLRMKLDKEDLNKHVNTIQLQIEVTEFLAKCDSCNRIAPVTLFGTDEDKINLAAKILITGASISDSLQLTERICKMYELSVRDVLCKATQQLALSERINDIRDLCNHFQDDFKLCDDFLLAALKHKSQNCDSLINRITDLSTKIQAYIDCGLLKAAYLLASKHNRLEDVHKVLIAAESLNQPLIKKICLKRLNAEELPSSSSSST